MKQLEPGKVLPLLDGLSRLLLDAHALLIELQKGIFLLLYRNADKFHAQFHSHPPPRSLPMLAYNLSAFIFLPVTSDTIIDDHAK